MSARPAAPLARPTACMLLAMLAACGNEPEPQPAAYPDSLARDETAAPPETGAQPAAPAELLAVAQQGAAEDVVRLLLQWDTAGLRFEGPYADALAQLYCYLPDQQCLSDEPAWDFSLVVDGYTLDPVFESEDSAQFVAIFDEIGAAWPDGLQGPVGSPPETISLKRMAGRWRVVGLDSQLPPHLSANGLLRTYRGVHPDSGVVARWLRERK